MLETNYTNYKNKKRVICVHNKVHTSMFDPKIYVVKFVLSLAVIASLYFVW